MRIPGTIVLSVCGVFVSTGTARAQFGRGPGDWMTSGGDAQRSSWIRTDPKISVSGMQKPDFKFLWKVKLGNGQSANPLAVPVLLNSYIGYRGFRSLAFVGGSANDIHAIDTDLGRIEWQNRFTAAAPPQAGCSSTMTAVTRPATVAFPTPGGGGVGGGRGGPARSGVGNPDEGAVTLAQVPAVRPTLPPVTATPSAPGIPRPAAPGGFRMPSLVYALTSDGMLHSMYLSNGSEPKPPVKFLPANAGANGLIVVDDVAYITTPQGCGEVPSGIRALNLGSMETAAWEAKGGVSGSAGSAFGPDGTVYVATGQGTLAALEPKTLALKDSYEAGQGFTTSPVVFEYKDKTLIAAATKDGRIHLLDSKALGGADRHASLYTTPASPGAGGSVGGALASWQDATGTRWVLAPTSGALVAWKIMDRNGTPALEQGWVSRDMASPLPPMVINGVVFAASGGKSPAVLYALDGATGKDLWNSGKTITSSVRGGGLSGGGSQVYLGTSDGTFYAFGFYIEH